MTRKRDIASAQQARRMPLVAGQLGKAYFLEKASLEKLTEVGHPNINPQRVSRPGAFLGVCS